MYDYQTILLHYFIPYDVHVITSPKIYPHLCFHILLLLAYTHLDL